ncbi:MAG: ATP-binding protein [Pseudorhizobium sp.]
MPVIQYPFIDVAVHQKVCEPFAAGKAVVLFSVDMTEVLWANGRGAQLFGYGSVYDLLDQGPLPQDVSFRQIASAGRRLQAIDDVVALTIRIPAGFQRVTVPASCTLVDVCGEAAVLFTAATERLPASSQAAAASMIEGLDDPDTHIAILDDDGAVIAGSARFAELGLTQQTARMLVTMAGSEASRLVKRPVPTLKGYLPAAMGSVSSNPPLHLLFVVEAVAAGVDQPAADDADDAAHEPVEVAAEASADSDYSSYQEVLEAVAHLEETPEPEDIIALDLPVEEPEKDEPEIADASDETEAALAPVLAPAEPQAVDASPSGEPEDPVVHDAPTSTLAPQEPTADVAGVAEEGFLFRRDARATRFVWKIDAEGRFCEVSGEFAKAVGPHAADINGMAFGDVAGLFHLDPDGKIAELLRKRDTWSGKTIWWPIEGTSLVVPIDLAALPTYTRTRTFDGFRGFGIIRMSDAVEDSHGVGLVLGGGPAGGAVRAEEAPDADLSTSDPAAPEVEDIPAFAEQTLETAKPEETSSTETDVAPDAPDEIHDKDDQPVGDEQPEEVAPEATPLGWPTGERPALRLVEASVPASDKVINLENRRSRRESLSPVEQAAFREIARQLDSFIGRDDEAETEEPPQTSENAVEDDANTSAEEQRDQAPTDDGNDRTDEISATSTDEVTASDDEMSEVTTSETDASSDIGDDDPDAEQQDTAVAAPDDLDATPPVSLHRERNGLTAEILDQMPVALLVHSGDRLIHGNPEFLRLTGYGSLDALSEVGGLDALLQRQDLEGKTAEAGGMVVVRADDTIVPVTARLQSVRFEQTGALMLALMPVATEQQPDNGASDAGKVVSLSASRLQVEVEELRAILETATDGVVVIEASGDIRSMNGAASALFNYDTTEAAGKPFVMLFAHESQRAIVNYLGGLSDNGVASVLNDGREVIGREASGGFIPLFMTIGRLTSSNGYCAVIRDITQWKRTEEELRTAKGSAETANAHKSEFLAHVSHEIRTPLNAIIGFADLMASERFGPIGHPRYVEYANDIVRSGRHVLDIVNDLLDISKIEAGEMELDFVSVELNETISESISLVQPQANSQRVIIRTALSQAVPPVVADLRSVKQIVLNILSNAIRYTPSGGQIVVSTAYEANGSVILRVRDTGIGMNRQELETAMKPFRQVAGNTRKRGDGTGLGLPLTKAMVDANRANFFIHSAPREGTLVEISFPPQRVLAN